MVQLLKPDELQEQLRISERTMYRMIADGSLPFVRIRGGLRFNEAVIDAMVEEQTVVRG